MKTVAVFEAKNRFSELVVAAEQGEDITITRHGLPAARLVSIGVTTPVQPQQRVAGIMQRLRQLGAEGTLGCTLQQALGQGRD